MMFGTRDEFDYFECERCGGLQLVSEVDVADYYPTDYHAFLPQSRPRGLRGLARRWRDRGVFRGDLIGRLLNRVAPYPVLGAERWFRVLDVPRDARIVDVGCGSAELLRDLHASGFSNLTGIDLYLPDEVLPLLPPFVRKGDMADLDGLFDVVMLHHVLEHMPDQDAALRAVAALLHPDGVALVRIPVIGAAWEQYGEDWVQIDAPRHFYIHSIRSFERLAARAGLTVERIDYDSTEFQFTGSELYRRDVPLTQLPTAYSPGQLRHFRREARRLNRLGRGDQAAFYLRKTA